MSQVNETIIKRYTELLNRYGFSHKSLDWGSRESQIRRFEVLAGVGDLSGKSILDVGCGLCDLYQYLNDRDVCVEYHGIDITSQMVDVSHGRFPNLHIEVRDIVKHPLRDKYDYVFSSGTMYLFSEKKNAFDLISAMHESANIGIAFNALSQCAIMKEAGELYLLPSEVLEYCISLTRSVVLRHDYLANDFTMYMYKESL